MSGPIGVMSHAIILKAGLLLISARIDLHHVDAVIDPSSPITVADPSEARYLDVDPINPGPLKVIKKRIIGIDHDEMRIHQIDIQPIQPAADLIIGSDLLSDMRIGFDFTRSKLRVFDAGDRHVGQGMRTIAVAVSKTSGCLIADARNERGDPIRIAISGRPAGSEIPARTLVQVSMGGVPMNALRFSPGTGPCLDSDALVTWGNFAGQRIVFDIGHKQMWISSNQ